MLGKQDFDLDILRRFGHGRGHEPRLTPTRFALVLGQVTLSPVMSNVFAVIVGTQMLRINHVLIYALTLQ